MSKSSNSVVKLVSIQLNEKKEIVKSDQGTGYFVAGAGDSCVLATADHVIKPTDPTLPEINIAILADGKEYVAQPLIRAPSADEALLKVVNVSDPQSLCQPLELEDHPTGKIGDQVATGGFPDNGQFVAATGRLLGVENRASLTRQGVNMEDNPDLSMDLPLIMVAAEGTADHGSSGGPWMDANGKVLGTMSMGFSKPDSKADVSAFVPAEYMQKLIDALKKPAE